MPRHIVKLCANCGGTGFRLASAQPIKFKPCNKCSGRGGRTVDKLENLLGHKTVSGSQTSVGRV